MDGQPSDEPAGNKTLYALVEFDTPLWCAKEVLGSSTPVSIGGVPGHLKLPFLPDWPENPEDRLWVPLLGPPEARTWKRGDHLMQWGRPHSYPAGDSAVSLVLITFDTSESDLSETAIAVTRDYDRWRAVFVDCVELLTRLRHPPRVHAPDQADGLEMFYLSESGKLKRPEVRDKPPITIIMYDDDTRLKPSTLETVCRVASSGELISLNYKLQLDAYRAMGVGDYRTAIVHTAVAAEVALTTAIRNKLAGSGTGYEDKLRKFRMLRKRLELASTIGLQLPASREEIEKVLVNPRNSVMHEGAELESHAAHKAVVMTDSIFDSLACPLVGAFPL